MPEPRPLHIVLLNQAFHPDVVATAQMAKDLADSLAARGHTVTAIASRSLYGQAGATLPPRETLAVGKGRIEIHRVGASLFGKAGIAARLADFALFYLLAAFKVLSIPRPDVVVGFTTPPFIALLGIICRWLRGSRAIHWVMDLYPDVPVACGMMKPTGPLHAVLDAVSRWILRQSDTNVVLGRCMQERVLAKGTPAGKVAFIPVWADLAGVEPVPSERNTLRREWAPNNELLVMYSGNLGIAHDVATMLDAMRRLKDEAGIKFVFVGSGKRRAEVESFASMNGLTNVAFLPYQPREKLGESLSAGDLHLVSLREGAEGCIVPSKLFGIMAVARPALFIGSPKSEIARVLDESGGGLAFREGEGEKLSQTILQLRADMQRRRDMGDRALAGLKGKYDRDTACAQWIALLEQSAPATP